MCPRRRTRTLLHNFRKHLRPDRRIEQETGTDKQDVHDYYCNLYLRRTTIIKGKETVIAGSTSKLNTLQLTDFLNKVKADAATELGITLPLPEDRYYNEFVNEYKYRR